jgi:hypothetical protein
MQLLEYIPRENESIRDLIMHVLDTRLITADKSGAPKETEYSISAYLWLFQTYSSQLSAEDGRYIVTRFNWELIYEIGVDGCSHADNICLLSELKFMGMGMCDIHKIFWIIYPSLVRGNLEHDLQSLTYESSYKVQLTLLQMLIENNKKKSRWPRSTWLILEALENNLASLENANMDLQVLYPLLNQVRNLPM